MHLLNDPAFVAFAGLLLATGVLRLVEIAVSVRRVRLRPESLVREPWVFPLMVLLHSGLVFGPLAEVLLLERPVVAGLAAGAGSILVLAVGLRVWTLRTIGRSWNVRVVVPPADGIVTTGPYAWIRHPNYLAVILEIATLPLLHTAWISCLTLSSINAFVLFHRIRTEEAQLEEIDEWRRTMAGRPRLIPRRRGQTSVCPPSG